MKWEDKIIYGLLIICFLIMFTWVIIVTTENCPDCKCDNVVDIPLCPSCNVTCPACPDCVCNISSSLINVGAQEVLSSPNLDLPSESFIFDSKCDGEPYAIMLYDPDEKLCRRNIDDDVRIGFNPTQCCRLSSPSVKCMTLGNSSMSGGYGSWKGLRCYK